MIEGEVVKPEGRMALTVWLIANRVDLRERRISAAVAEQLDKEPGRPEWGSDWGPWLRENLERIVGRF